MKLIHQMILKQTPVKSSQVMRRRRQTNLPCPFTPLHLRPGHGNAISLKALREKKLESCDQANEEQRHRAAQLIQFN